MFSSSLSVYFCFLVIIVYTHIPYFIILIIIKINIVIQLLRLQMQRNKHLQTNKMHIYPKLHLRQTTHHELGKFSHQLPQVDEPLYSSSSSSSSSFDPLDGVANTMRIRYTPVSLLWMTLDRLIFLPSIRHPLDSVGAPTLRALV